MCPNSCRPNALRFLQELDPKVIAFLEPQEHAEVLTLTGQIDTTTDRSIAKMSL